MRRLGIVFPPFFCENKIAAAPFPCAAARLLSLNKVNALLRTKVTR
jgi:hypothetical protein